MLCLLLLHKWVAFYLNFLEVVKAELDICEGRGTERFSCRLAFYFIVQHFFNFLFWVHTKFMITYLISVHVHQFFFFKSEKKSFYLGVHQFFHFLNRKILVPKLFSEALKMNHIMMRHSKSLREKETLHN